MSSFVLVYGLYSRWIVFRFPEGARIFISSLRLPGHLLDCILIPGRRKKFYLFSKASRSFAEHNLLFVGCRNFIPQYIGLDVKVATNLHLVSRPRINGVITALLNTLSWREHGPRYVSLFKY